MKKPIMFLGIIFFLCSLKSAAFADYYSREFGDMDTSHDDFVNFEEYRYYVSGATVEAFKKIDTNKDKKIDFFEWVEFQEREYPFESKCGFKYKGKSGIWYIDRHGNRYKNRYGYYYRYRRDCWLDHPCDRWHWHHHGFYCCHRECLVRRGWTITFGISNTHLSR